MATASAFEVLGVDIDAPIEEVRKAYLKRAREYHPDKNPDSNAADRFKKINAA